MELGQDHCMTPAAPTETGGGRIICLSFFLSGFLSITSQNYRCWTEYKRKSVTRVPDRPTWILGLAQIFSFGNVHYDLDSRLWCRIFVSVNLDHIFLLRIKHFIDYVCAVAFE